MPVHSDPDQDPEVMAGAELTLNFRLLLASSWWSLAHASPADLHLLSWTLLRMLTVEKSRRKRLRTPTPGQYLGLKSTRDHGAHLMVEGQGGTDQGHLSILLVVLESEERQKYTNRSGREMQGMDKLETEMEGFTRPMQQCDEQEAPAASCRDEPLPLEKLV
ncbi:hypothetical protein NL676_006442 [Syzygium grande]|nr:hypothetical protein NL676_006442 [Syzygium grande]